MNTMQRLRLTLLANKLTIMLIPCLIFSYLPVLVLGQTAGMRIELSFLYLLTALTVVAGLLTIRTKQLRSLFHTPSYILLATFIVYLFVSLLWTTNPTRGVVTSLFFAMLFGLSTVFASRISFFRKNWPVIRKSSFAALFIVSLWAVWQVIADALLLPRTLTGLPTMYSDDVFGIARPTAFSLEPQFFGSLLLIPLLWSLYQLLSTHTRKYVVLTTYVISTTLLFMTLSRGAIVAALVGGVVALLIIRPTFRRVMLATGLTVASFIGLLIIVCGVATLRADTISGPEATRRVISQLSLGSISLPAPATTKPNETKFSPLKQQIVSQGYVAESTDSRLTMAERAIELWQQSPQTVLFGVGIGGFGVSSNQIDKTLPISSIVNNYYLELLAETGIIGAVLFGGFVFTLLIALLKRRATVSTILLTALLVQMSFFSGNANIIHIWVIVGVCIGIVTAERKSACSSSRLVQ